MALGSLGLREVPLAIRTQEEISAEEERKRDRCSGFVSVAQAPLTAVAPLRTLRCAPLADWPAVFAVSRKGQGGRVYSRPILECSLLDCCRRDGR